ncbi:MAG: hypothetical protein QOJ58_5345 [Alphaproteobacteria bacterium]|jgi:hypothetical protein|nr:hypothetical protein [Alphaproteobacteria bacterium]
MPFDRNTAHRAVTADRTVYQRRIVRLQPFAGKAQAIHHARLQVLHEHIRARDEFF